ncbi:hypothetical protein ABIA33_005188 [Streptacidiphilus sp. MAP12-16]|uniref:hypothetical protein n=1 Tax=Streptacidiphilus sp. MAP12-16 TaxID=3156300 RepID=UPI003516B030
MASQVQSARRVVGLRQASLGLCVMLIAEYALGVAVNIYVTVPKSYQGNGLGKAFGDALTKGPTALVVHAAVGLLVVVAAVTLLVRAILARHVVVITTASIALLAVIGAANSGASFVDTGQNSASLVMALLTALALLCAVSNLYLLGRAAGATSSSQ